MDPKKKALFMEALANAGGKMPPKGKGKPAPKGKGKPSPKGKGKFPPKGKKKPTKE